MKIRTHFKHNVFMLDEAGELLEHLGGTESAGRISGFRWEMALGLCMTTRGVWWCGQRLRWATRCAVQIGPFAPVLRQDLNK
jgi:hypothetical protein